MDKKHLGVAVVFLIITLFGILGFSPLFQYKLDIQESKQTSAVVQNTSINVVETDDGTYYEPIVKYTYTVNSTQYTDNNIYPPHGQNVDYGSRGAAQKVVSAYPENTPVTANYRPREPGSAYLNENSGVYSTWLYMTIGYIVVVLFFSTWMIKKGFVRWKQKKWIRDTPTQDIESLSIGPSEIKGRFDAKDDPLSAPFSDEECVYYKYRIQEYKHSGDDKSWQTIDRGSSHTPMYVDDGTGRVLVIPHEETYFEVKSEDTNEYGSSRSPPNSKIKQFVENNDEIDKTDNKRKYREEIIKNKEDGYVFGTAQVEDTDLSDNDDKSNAGRLCIKKVVDNSLSEPLFMIAGVSEEEVVDRRDFALWRVPYGAIYLVIALFMLLVGLSLYFGYPVPVWLV